MARKFLVSIDLSKNELQNAVIQNLATAPASPTAGQIYYNTVDNQLYIYNGTRWEVAGNAVQSGTLASRPAAGSVDAGTIYYATDNYLFYYSNGSTWQQTNNFGTVTTETSYGQSSTDGTSTNYARADHSHGTPALGTSTPSAVANATGSAGSGTLPSKQDHTHAFVPTADISFAGYKITNLADPSASTDAANKQYVDSVAQGLNIHDPVKAATTTTLAATTGGTVTYNNGTAGVGATLTLSVALTTLDGYTVQTGDRLIIKNEATAANNGVYTINAGKTILTRATDADSTAELNGGDFFFVQNGTVNDNTGWVVVDPVTTIGTTPVVFYQFSGAGTYTASNGVLLTGSNFTGVVKASGGLTVDTDGFYLDTTIAVRKYSTSVGDGSATSYTVTHNLGTRDVTVVVYDNSSPYGEVICDVNHTSTSTITVLFSVAPTSNQYRVVVHG